MLATDLFLQKIKTLNGVKSCMLVGQDGLIIDGVLPTNLEIDKDYFSAIVSSIYNDTSKQSIRFKRGKPKIMTLETEESVLVFRHVEVEHDSYVIFVEFKKGMDIVFLMDAIKEATKLFK